MDLSFLDQKSDITPLLVKLYDQHKLYDMAHEDKPKARNELAGGIVGLLSRELSVRESEAISDILVELIRQAEKDLRVAVSERLATLDSVPLRLALQIAHDEIDVAAPLLRSCPVFGDLDLVYIIKSKPAPYWRVIAERKTMSDQIMSTLVDTGDIHTAITLAENQAITLNDHVLSVLSDMAQKHEEIAAPLVRREEVTPEILAALYEFVGEAIKSDIRRRHPQISEEADSIVDQMTIELTAVNQFSADTHLDIARRMAERGTLTMNTMVDVLKRGQYDMFVAQLSVFSGLKVSLVQDILKQPSGQGLAILCKATDVVKSDFLSLYLLSRKMHHAGQAMETADLNKAEAYFDRLTPDVARTILSDSLQ